MHMHFVKGLKWPVFEAETEALTDSIRYFHAHAFKKEETGQFFSKSTSNRKGKLVLEN